MSALTAYGMDAHHHLGISWNQLDPWTQHQLRNVIDLCDDRHWSILHISETQSRVLPPVLSIWQVTVRYKKVDILICHSSSL